MKRWPHGALKTAPKKKATSNVSRKRKRTSETPFDVQKLATAIVKALALGGRRGNKAADVAERKATRVGSNAHSQDSCLCQHAGCVDLVCLLRSSSPIVGQPTELSNLVLGFRAWAACDLTW